MITALHAVIYSSHREKVMAFLRDVLRWDSVDAGNGRLMFAAPPTEIGVHETDGDAGHELYFICDDIAQTIADLEKHGVAAAPIVDRGWGLVTELTLPSGDTIGMYEPRHASPLRKEA